MQRLPSGSRIAFAVRVVVSLAILVLVLSRVSVADLAAQAELPAPAPILAAVLVVALMAVLVAVRWRLLAGWLRLALPMALAVRAVFLGLFGGQALPSALGTDLLRGWVVFRSTGRMRLVAASLLADRLVALFAACVLVALPHALLGGPAGYRGALIVPAAVLVGSGVLVAFLVACARMPGPEGVAPRVRPVLFALAAALAIHALAVVAAALTAAAYGTDASLGVWLSIIPVSIVACALPVSINGWGVREAVIVALAGGHGVSPVDALLVSLTLGAVNVVASLPGAFLLVGSGKSGDTT